MRPTGASSDAARGAVEEALKKPFVPAIVEAAVVGDVEAVEEAAVVMTVAAADVASEDAVEEARLDARVVVDVVVPATVATSGRDVPMRSRCNVHISHVTATRQTSPKGSGLLVGTRPGRAFGTGPSNAATPKRTLLADNLASSCSTTCTRVPAAVASALLFQSIPSNRQIAVQDDASAVTAAFADAKNLFGPLALPSVPKTDDSRYTSATRVRPVVSN